MRDDVGLDQGGSSRHLKKLDSAYTFMLKVGVINLLMDWIWSTKEKMSQEYFQEF